MVSDSAVARDAVIAIKIEGKTFMAMRLGTIELFSVGICISNFMRAAKFKFMSTFHMVSDKIERISVTAKKLLLAQAR